MKKRSSRVEQVDIEKCIRNSGVGRFDMILMAAARAREIRKQHKTSQEFEHLHTPVTALLEIQAGPIETQEYLAKIK
jgi:DNA-directed RNA polymerase subunit K/omega